MEELRQKKYLAVTKRKFHPISIVLGIVGILGVVVSVSTLKDLKQYLDIRSVVAIFGGTFGVLLFQFNIRTLLGTFKLLLQSFWGIPDKETMQLIGQLDQAILQRSHLSTLREGRELNGDFINDALYMLQQGLIYEEIETFFNAKIADEYQIRERYVDLLLKGSTVAPGLGLFGTVMGLIGVLSTLSDPSQIGPSMSLALMTTAYGAGLGSLVFIPMAGRLEQHNFTFLEIHQQMLSKLKILVSREERRFDRELHVEDMERSA
ncbi:MAG: MotA/TolQ/ExbB proton channel family protein [Halobacteriovoraceae bacterium]|nr:MotA/TolQ/ExbB proton channel family protein [Halobacteriovoraceae bacterium]